MAKWLEKRRKALPPPTKGKRSGKDGSAYLIYNRTGQSATGYKLMENGKIAMALRVLVVVRELTGESGDRILDEIKAEIASEDRAELLKTLEDSRPKKPRKAKR